MKCEYCNFETEQEFLFCPNCGRKVQAEQTVLQYNNVYAKPLSFNPMADMMLDALKDKMFLVVCILISASVIFSLSNNSIDIVGILISVFLWLTYASARKGIADYKHIRSISGTYYALYIICFVTSILFFAMLTLLVSLLGLAFFLDKELVTQTLETLANVDLGSLFNLLLAKSKWLFFPICVFYGSLMILITFLVIRPTHRFLKSVYKSIETGVPLFCNVNIAKNLFLICGILSGISAIPSLFGGDLREFAEDGALAAALVLLSILIKEYIFNSSIVSRNSKN